MSLRSYGMCFAVLALFILLTHAYPFWLSSAPLGFDTGIYRYEILHAIQSLPQLSSGLFPGLPLLTDVFSVFGVGGDTLMREVYLLSFLVLAALLCLVATRHWGRKAGILALLLFAVSLAQWQLFEMLLYKQVVAMSFVFLSLWLLERRSTTAVFPLLFLGLLQPLDLFLLGLSVLFFNLFSLRQPSAQRRYFLTLFVSGLMIGTFLLFLEPQLWSKAWELFSQGILSPSELEYSAQAGIFLELSDYGYQAALVFLVGVLGAVKDARDRGFSLLHSYALIIALWISFGMFFHNRLLIQMDLVLILFGAFFLSQLAEHWWRDRLGKAILSLTLFALALPFFYRLSHFSPSVPADELQVISSFCSALPPETQVMATDGTYGPWLRGYCPHQQVIAPDLFEYDRWSTEQWLQFWSGDPEVMRTLLQKYSGELYLYVGRRQTPVELPRQSFEDLGAGWYRWLTP